MNKAVIASIVAGGMCGSILAPLMPSIMAQSLPNIRSVFATPNPSGVELLNAGAEPRRELKFTPAVNSRQTLTMTMDASTEKIVGKTPSPQTSIPRIILKVDSIVERVDPSGDIHSRLIYTDIQAVGNRNTPPELLAFVRKSRNNLSGIRMDLVVGGNGQVKSKQLTIPKTVEPKLKSLLEQFELSMYELPTQLPKEKVGLGAKWRTNNTIKFSGIDFARSATSEITQIDDTGIKIKTQMTQSAPPQDSNSPGTTTKIDTRLTSISSSGEGSYVLRFNSLLPITGKFATKTEIGMSDRSSSKKPPTDTSGKISIDLGFESK